MKYREALASSPGIPLPDRSRHIASPEWIDCWLEQWGLDAPRLGETYAEKRHRALVYLNEGGWASLGYSKVVGLGLGLT